MGNDHHRRDLWLDPDSLSNKQSPRISIRKLAVRHTGLSPSPCDVAVVTSILKELAEKAGVDWELPLQSWSKDMMTNFLMLAWQLINKAEAARDQTGQDHRRPKPIGTRRETLFRDIPFARAASS